MANVVHFGMLIEINKLLKKNKCGYSLHSVGGCTSCGLELRNDGNFDEYENAIYLINEYLNDKYMQVKAQDNDPKYLYVISKFDLENEKS